MYMDDMWPTIPHYYGDIIRQLILGAAAVILIGAPFYADNLRLEFPFEVAGALLFAALAALTNPQKTSILTLDAVATGSGAFIYGSWALYGYDSVSPIVFVLRALVALLLLFAFYFSLKTVRAMLLQQIGKRDTSANFNNNNDHAAEQRPGHFRPPPEPPSEDAEEEEPPRRKVKEDDAKKEEEEDDEDEDDENANDPPSDEALDAFYEAKAGG